MKLQLASFNKIITVDLPENDIENIMDIVQNIERLHKEKKDIK